MEAISQQKKASNSSRPAFRVFVRLIIYPNFKRLKTTCPHKFKPFVMRKFLLSFLAISFLLACNNEKKTDTAEKELKDDTAAMPDTKTPSAAPVPSVYEALLGSYVGAFGDNKITLLITRADKDSVAGRSIVGGNDRPFAGTIAKKGYIFYVNAKEPGNDKYDGVFDFEIDENQPANVNGVWKPNDTKRPAKTFALTRKKFEYKAEVGSYPEASLRLLKPKDVENEMKEDLEFMRNEIFARHGYCFKKKHLRQQFEMEEWYVPNTVDIKGFLTDIEKKNIALIKRYEKYAEEYGDEYGR
jgi:YARHG domain